MKNKYMFALLAFLLMTNLFSQSNLSDYKYVIVPRQYDFLKGTDKYQLNSLTKFLLEKENFNVFFNDDRFPDDLYKDRCSAIYANVTEHKSMFKTKLLVELKDCNNNVLFVTREGSSKEKDYVKAYHGALRDAFQSFKAIKYNYEPTLTKQEVVEVTPVEEQIATKAISKEVIKEEVAAIKEEIKPMDESPVIKKSKTSNILYAQITDNGFQLMDKTPMVVYKIKRTGLNNVYLVDGKNAIIYKNGESWMLEYYQNNTLKQDVLNIKF